MSKFRKILKGVWLYSFLVEIVFIAYVFYYAIFGISFFTNIVYGFDAVVLLVICYGVVFAPFWIILVLFQGVCAIIFETNDEYKEISVKSYFKSKNFYIPILLVVLCLMVSFVVELYLSNKPYNYTDDFSNALESSYSTVVSSDSVDKDGYIGLCTYSELCDMVVNYNAYDLLYELWGTCDNENFSEDYMLIVTPVEHGTFVKDSIKCESVKHYLGKEIKLKLSYSIEDSDTNSVMVLYFKINDDLKFIDDDKLSLEWIKK